MTEPLTPVSGNRPYKRRARNFLIHKPMQREFILVMCALLIISILAVGYIIHTTLHEASSGGGFRFGKVSAYEVLSEVNYDLMVRVSGVLGFSLVVMTAFGVFFLHRVAGPVYRFRQAFIRLNEGDVPPPVKLREGDFFQETAEEINGFLKRVHFESTRLRVLKDKTAELLAAHPNDALTRPLQDLRRLLDQPPE